MGAFLSELEVTLTEKRQSGRAVFRLEKDFAYRIGDKKGDHKWIATMPAGEETDFASIPRVFWSIAQPAGKYMRAAVIHDHLCRRSKSGISRWMADAIFLEAMTTLKVPCWKKYMVYAGVRLYAWWAGLK